MSKSKPRVDNWNDDDGEDDFVDKLARERARRHQRQLINAQRSRIVIDEDEDDQTTK